MNIPREDDPPIDELPCPETLVMNSLTSKSEPIGPRHVFTSRLIGSFKFDALLFPNLLLWKGKRSTSYPAKTNLPSGGTKLSSPGFSRHLANLTHG